jgi:hypothetical protein
MSIKLTILDDKALTNALRKYGAKSEKAISEAVRVTATEIGSDANLSITRGSKTGRQYTYISEGKYTKIFSTQGLVKVIKNNGRNITHRASAPGEAPASDTGMLAGSIDVVKFSPLTYRVGTLLKYGRWLEYGTQKIAERPWLRPAVQRNKEEFFRRLRIAISS